MITIMNTHMLVALIYIFIIILLNFMLVKCLLLRCRIFSLSIFMTQKYKKMQNVGNT